MPGTTSSVVVAMMSAPRMGTERRKEERKERDNDYLFLDKHHIIRTLSCTLKTLLHKASSTLCGDTRRKVTFSKVNSLFLPISTEKKKKQLDSVLSETHMLC